MRAEMFYEYSEFFFSILRLATPLILAAIGGMLCEKSGVVHMGLEGILLFGAFVGASATFYTQSSFTGIISAALIGSLCGYLMSLAIVERKINSIIIGMAVNLIAIGSIPLLSKIIFDSTGSTPELAADSRLYWFPIFISLSLIPLSSYLIYNLKAGLWIQVCGQNPAALNSQGISPLVIQKWTLIVGSGLCGIGGAFLSLFLTSAYSPMMSGGRGFIALAAIVFARWRPAWVGAACYFFAAMEAIQIRLQGVEINGIKMPVQFIQILPYIAVLLTPVFNSLIAKKERAYEKIY